MTIALQNVLVPLTEIDKDLEACHRASIKPTLFGLIPFSDAVMPGDDVSDLEAPCVPFGSTKLIKLWEQHKLPLAWRIFYDREAFDARTYGPALGHLALNGFSIVSTYERIADRKWGVPVFIKPTNDLKAFPGKVIGDNASLADALKDTQTDDSLAPWTPVLVAPHREIVCEFRCWVNRTGQMIEASRYRSENRLDVQPVTADERLMLGNFVSEVHALFKPAPWYVVDVALMPDDALRVVEYNCLNCSGRYAADRAKLFKALVQCVSTDKWDAQHGHAAGSA